MRRAVMFALVCFPSVALAQPKAAPEPEPPAESQPDFSPPPPPLLPSIGALGVVPQGPTVAASPTLQEPEIGIFPAVPVDLVAQPLARPRDRYPRSLVVRKPILPNGVIEASALGSMGMIGNLDTKRFTVDPRLRCGIGRAELAGAVSVLVHHTSAMPAAAPETLAAASANVRYMFLPGATVGVEMTFRDPMGDPSKMQSRGLLGMKQRIGSYVALDATTTAGVDDTKTGSTRSRTAVVAGQLRVQVQIGAPFALEARGAVGYFDRLDDAAMAVKPYLSREAGARIVIGVSATADVIAGYDHLFANDVTTKVFTTGIALRRLP